MNKQIYNPNNFQLTLKEKEVHIWNFDLEFINDVTKKKLTELLSSDESERAFKFHFQKDRERFICGTGLLRILISKYIGIRAKLISFSYSKYGKPEILAGQNQKKLKFNMSNSQNNVCIGFIADQQIGIDIEVIKPIKDYFDVANNFFSNSEIAQLKSFPEEKSLEAFYTCWTGKEAFIKYLGEGLSHPLKNFDVQIKELNISSTYEYNILGKNAEDGALIESFRMNEDLFGAFAVYRKPDKTTYLNFDERTYSINKFIEDELG